MQSITLESGNGLRRSTFLPLQKWTRLPSWFRRVCIGSKQNPAGDASKTEGGIRDSDGSQSTAAAVELTAVLPLPSHHNRQQHTSGSISFSIKNRQHQYQHRQQLQLPTFCFFCNFETEQPSRRVLLLLCCCVQPTRATAPARSAPSTPCF